VDTIPTVPFDNHLIHALYVYPARGLIFIENSGIAYLGPWSNHQCVNAGRQVFQGLGAVDYVRFSQVSHADHRGFPATSKPDLTSFINRFLLDQPANTTIMRADGTFSMDETRWVDWAVLTLV
jgi:hypothetical protein